MSILQIALSTNASTAHRYWRDAWSAEKNAEVYGGDASSEGIGSNLCLEVAQHTELTGDEGVLLAPLQHLKSLVDHQCLFDEPHALAGRPSTLENITAYLLSQAGACHSVTVAETERLWCRMTRESASSVEMFFRQGPLTVSLRAEVDPLSGLAVSRASVLAVLSRQFGSREVLIATLKKEIKNFKSARIDLGRHEYLLVHSDS